MGLRVMGKNILFLGSGCSADMHLPLGDELRNIVMWNKNPGKRTNDLRVKYKKEINLVNEPTLEDIMAYEDSEALSLVKKALNSGASIYSYKYLLSGLNNKNPCYIVTVNHDVLLENTLNTEQKKESLVLNNNKDYSNFIEKKEYKLINIFKLHGSINDDESIKIKRQDTQELSEEKKEILRDIFNDSNVFFIGYSGRDQDIQKFFSNMNGKLNNCVIITTSKPRNELFAISHNFKKYYVINTDSMGFFTEIKNNGISVLDSLSIKGKEALTFRDNINFSTDLFKRHIQDEEQNTLSNIYKYISECFSNLSYQLNSQEYIGSGRYFRFKINKGGTYPSDNFFKERFPKEELSESTETCCMSFVRNGLPSSAIILMIHLKRNDPDIHCYSIIYKNEEIKTVYKNDIFNILKYDFRNNKYFISWLNDMYIIYKEKVDEFLTSTPLI
jgi:hypothetical protein